MYWLYRTNGVFEEISSESENSSETVVSETVKSTEEVSRKDNVMKSLEIMWKGCLAIFLVIGIIIGVTLVLNKLSSRKSKKADPEN